ncbi:MAG TPA: hypothetical protein VFN68_01130 [Acidimicrobiales bacterium]|nr:hypothetical protein [Acidimicrobiales bacterium]
MIDASKTPTPAWQRYLLAALLTVLIGVIAYMVYFRDLHRSGPTARPAASAAHSTVTAHPATASVAPTTTTIPGGIPISGRDPFGN